MLIGSEGILGVITEAWVRVRPRPRFRASAPVRFADFAAGADAVRALSQSGLYPTNCRLIDAGEAEMTGAGDGSYALLVLGFESPTTTSSTRCAGAGVLRRPRRDLGAARIGSRSGSRSGPGSGSGGRAVGSWREAFLRAPYLRDTFVAMGVLSETFETAITWDRFAAFHERVIGAVRGASARSAAAARSRAASPTSIPTAPPRTTRSSRRRAAAPSSSSGPRSSAPRRTR